ncbi:MAG: hypothetical protein QOE79_1145 [Sphingomonadales bacterium]|jgi:hypothetical protein|nr:hypothetical protein [Sphingomonadales bacterium]MEA3048390.1 hypothetical protein [Sphingomonadales bacterium]
MAKSRLAAGLLLIAWQAEAVAAPTAEQAMAQYRRTFQPVDQLRCPKGAGSEDIVVCGRREGRDPNRVPLPDEREPGERVALVAGEAPSATEGLARTDRGPCETAGPNHSCGGGISFLSILFGMIKIAKAVHDRHAD